MTPPSPLPHHLDAERLLAVEAMPLSQLLFSLRGRIPRATYWRVGVVGLLGAGLVLVALLRIAGLTADRAEQATSLVLAWPGIAISVKRWHDRDRSGWWVLVNLVPRIGWLWGFIDNAFVRSSPSANRYGPPPQAPERLI